MALSIDMKVAVIGSTAALIGTLAGGGVTWWQTRDLQERQFARDDRARARATSSAAVVEANRYEVATSAVESMNGTHFYIDVSDRLKPRVSVAETELIVESLGPAARAARNDADLCVSLLASKIRGHGMGVDQIPRELRPALARDGECAAAGAKALAPLARRSPDR